MAFYITPRLRLCNISNCTYSLQLEPNNAPHVAVVVSPLGSLMVDQLQRCADMNVKAIMVNRATEVGYNWVFWHSLAYLVQFSRPKFNQGQHFA